MFNKFDTEELACKIVGLDYDEIDADTELIEEKLYDEFGIDLEVFTKLINKLVPLIDVGTSPLTGETFKGFSNQNGLWLLKMRVEKKNKTTCRNVENSTT